MFWASGVSEVGGVLKRLDNKFMNSILCILRIGNCWPSAYHCIALQLKSAAQRVKCIGVNVLRLDSNPIREATPDHFSCFFIKLIKGGRGVIPVYKNLCCEFCIFWRALAT